MQNSYIFNNSHGLCRLSIKSARNYNLNRKVFLSNSQKIALTIVKMVKIRGIS